jgi:glycosyltransferase involved in cell wall biosynthesis
MTLIDVAIPNYNYGRYIRSCVESVTSQGIADLRILIIDNASTDDSGTIIRELAASDPRIQVRLRERNLGAHSSFNEAIEWASSKYFVILCADDLLLPGSLAGFIAALEAEPRANIAYGKTVFVADPANISRVPASVTSYQAISGRQLLGAFCESGQNPVDGPMAVVRTAVQKHIGPYNIDLPHTDDAEMWMRFALLGGAVVFSDPMTVTRIHGANQSGALSTVHHWSVAMENAFESFFSRYGGILSDARTLRAVARRSLSDRAYWCAVSKLVRGEPGAIELLRFALRLRPASLIAPPLSRLFKDPTGLQRAFAALLGRKRAPAGQ